MDSFLILLNEISYELTDDELQSLIHIYNVPGGLRKHINSGLALFHYMMRQDFISRDNIENLHRLMRKIRPARRDLVRKVEKYIEKEFETADFRTVITDLSESWEKIEHNTGGGSGPGTLASPTPEEAATCNIDCAYVNCLCRCRRVPSCYTPAILLLLVLIIATAVFWYADVPEITDGIKHNAQLKKAGIYILLSEILVLFLVIFLRVRRVIDRCVVGQTSGYTVLRSPGIQAPREIVASTSTDGLANVPTSAPKPFRPDRPSSESAVFSSYTSGEPGSISTCGGTMGEPKGFDVNSGPEV
ncbi:uncharacterized protein LOC114535844 [Dendronephthya gigantea]|uniref:uncharacterized protein LOC114535844 n=1 Tax=Dendronephthya gigantea TaxID=151771 RepID=UPI00106D013C|nr:uncharacterized protein LOC114535844 [Dendronephthya gigantea]